MLSVCRRAHPYLSEPRAKRAIVVFPESLCQDIALQVSRDGSALVLSVDNADRRIDTVGYTKY